MIDEITICALGRLDIHSGATDLTIQLPSKARALLVYLAYTRRPHSRSALAGLLWAELSEEAARANLRLVLSRLRAVVGDALLITRHSVAFNLARPHYFDVAEFEELTSVSDGLSNDEMGRATALYGGPFLDDFHLREAPEFELWTVAERERLQRRIVEVLFKAAQRAHLAHKLAEAMEATRRILALEPWQEEAHQLLMRLLAAAGQRSAALAHYESCRHILADELGVEPSAATVALYDEIRNETFSAKAGGDEAASHLTVPIPQPVAAAALAKFTGAHRPASMPVAAKVAAATAPLFVARDREMSRLAAAWAQAKLEGGRPLFVLGGAGYGKTALVKEFARRAQAADRELLMAWGSCNAHTGMGEPYAPFREILLLLTGNIEAHWQGDLLTPEQALRLWDLMPTALPLLVDHGPDLVSGFGLGDLLLERSHQFAEPNAEWVQRLHKMPTITTDANLEQRRLFSQYVAFLKALAARQPLLLLFDNLHWADSSSLSLLFTLSQQIGESPILLIGTYRPEEVETGISAESRALQGLVGECKRLYGNVMVDLGEASRTEERTFVTHYLGTQPNRFGLDFADALYRQTEGHPLFIVELMRDLQERGSIQQDGDGYWREVAPIDWQRLPARVEGVIEMRIKRLDNDMQALLATAAVEGSTFTAEVVTRVQGESGRTLIGRMSHELDRQHRLITVQALETVNGQRLSRYRFRHQLFQYYLYNRLDKVERAYLHEAVGYALEALYGKQAPMAAALARHFELAGLLPTAIEYLVLAGENAVRLSAYTEAATHFQHGIKLLTTLPNAADHLLTQLQLQTGLCNALLVTRGYAAPEVEEAHQAAYALCEQVGETATLFSVFYGLWSFFHVRGAHARARVLAERWLQQAKAQPDIGPLLTGQRALGVTLLHMGELAAARTHLQACIQLYQPGRHGALVLRYGADPGAAAQILLAWTLWLLGEPDAAKECGQQALQRARSIAHPFTLAFVHVHAAMLHLFADEVVAARTETDSALRVCQENEYPFWQTVTLVLDGYLRFCGGEIEDSIGQMERALHSYANMGATLWRPWLLGLLARVYEQQSQVEAAHHARQQAREVATQNSERWHLSLQTTLPLLGDTNVS